MRTFLTTLITLLGTTGLAQAFTFPSIDGGTIDLDQWRGQPVLVVNTASLCGFTDQYDGLQALYDRYRADGLVVLAVPSDDFNQELSSAAEVKHFCEVNFNLNIPMADVTPVKGPAAHAFYKWVEQQAGFTPNWNFNKVLIAPDGAIAATYRSVTRPEGKAMTAAVEALLERD